MIGLLGAALLLLKITYFAALVPIAAIALVQMHGLRGFAAACVAGLAVVLPVTLMLGVGYWMAYAEDLRLVAGTELRPDLGASLSQIAAAPQFIGGTLLAIAAAMMIRRVAPPVTGLAAFLMIPAFLYIASQNFGHAQLWLVLLTVLLLAMRPEAGAVDFLGTDLRPAMTCAAVAAFAVALPSVFNIAKSPLSNMAYDKSRFLLLMPEETGHSDVFARQDRAYMPTAQVYMDQRLDDWAPYGPVVERADVPELKGVSFPFCEFQAGSRAMLETLGAELVDAGVPEGSRLFTADLLAAYWFFAPVVPPEGSAPWYYGQLTGLENTDYVMVPKCPFATRARDIIIGELAASDMAFTLVRDNDLMALFRVGGDRDQPNISPATR